ncbi:IS200/IS605 family element transposase accessory protein TnpB [Anabaena sphaerica FACHB-251]|uniref:IS200/IS605 family element transposase accessory protein TnpB n=1 Tax=Anabaena sphaerica FACHB-251 TaxID=2692883 RepID=A0A926WLI2_9NOST|nr:RNA-guided endonuclease TnpB family protein [Anabaena sphaerica]MBD2296185.1 IS200/IS605 family element transposase accessory protein TnpB [Anabaena sphaerica FACHB-251]
MRLVERHIIKQNHIRFRKIDKMSFLSKNLFNCAVYLCRQAVFRGQPIPTFNQIYHSLKKSYDYKALPSKVAQLVFKQVDKCFKSYQEAKKEYKLNPGKFLGEPKLPKYKHKQKGRNVLTFNNQAVSKKALKKGLISPSGLSILIKTKLVQIEEVRIIPKNNVYIIEAVYEREETTLRVQQSPIDGNRQDGGCFTIESNNRIAAIDIGLNNLATVSSNCLDFQPFIVCGKAIKSCNQFYNKVKASLQSQLPKNQKTSRKIEALTLKRNNKVDYYLHTASRFIINQLVSQNITHLIIGKNENWKQNINLGSKTNQNFTNIPHARFIQQLEYKAKLVGIKVQITEESYTSKCSFLDFEPIKKHEQYLGKRVKRGLFKSRSGKPYSADLNGSLNILRKVAGESIFDRNSVERLVVSIGKV